MEYDITFKSDLLKISGTLILPESEYKLPVVLMVPGSGQVDRNENHPRMPLNLFFEIAAHLYRNDVASLRYDKRGVGKSEGDYWTTGLFDNVNDAFAAYNFLKNHEKIDSERIFILGHSEGAYIAIRLASTGIDIRGTILLAGGVRSGEDEIKWQAVQVARGTKGLNAFLIKLLRINIEKMQQKQLDKIKKTTKDYTRIQLIARLNAKWMREFLSYNPADDMAKIGSPVLAITGEKDIQVDPNNLKIMDTLIKSPFEYHIIPDGTHIFRIEKGTPTLSTYKKQIKQPVDSRILDIIDIWLKKYI